MQPDPFTLWVVKDGPISGDPLIRAQRFLQLPDREDQREAGIGSRFPQCFTPRRTADHNAGERQQTDRHNHQQDQHGKGHNQGKPARLPATEAF